MKCNSLGHPRATGCQMNQAHITQIANKIPCSNDMSTQLQQNSTPCFPAQSNSGTSRPEIAGGSGRQWEVSFLSAKWVQPRVRGRNHATQQELALQALSIVVSCAPLNPRCATVLAEFERRTSQCPRDAHLGCLRNIRQIEDAQRHRNPNWEQLQGLSSQQRIP